MSTLFKAVEGQVIRFFASAEGVVVPTEDKGSLLVILSKDGAPFDESENDVTYVLWDPGSPEDLLIDGIFQIELEKEETDCDTLDGYVLYLKTGEQVASFFSRSTRGLMKAIESAEDIPEIPTLEQAIMGLYTQWRNGGKQTADTQTVSDNVGDPVLARVVSDDGTTFKQGQLMDS